MEIREYRKGEIRELEEWRCGVRSVPRGSGYTERERASLWGPGLFYPLTPLCSSSASPIQSATVPYAAIYDSMQSINKHVYCTMQANYNDITGALIITIQLPVNVTRWQSNCNCKKQFVCHLFVFLITVLSAQWNKMSHK